MFTNVTHGHNSCSEHLNNMLKGVCVCVPEKIFPQTSDRENLPPLPPPPPPISKKKKKERKKKEREKEVNIKFNNVPERNLHDNQVWDPPSLPLSLQPRTTESGVSPATLSQAHNNISLLNSALQRCLGPPPPPQPPPPSLLPHEYFLHEHMAAETLIKYSGVCVNFEASELRFIPARWEQNVQSLKINLQ